MAVGAWTFYNKARKNLGAGSIPLANSMSTLRVSLFTSASNAATATLSTIGSVTNELTEANGYSSSGKALGTVTWTAGASAGQYRLNSSTLVWTATGGAISNIKFAVIWYNGASAGARKLLLRSTLSTSQFTLSQNNTMTITMAATGIFNLA
jgi:hypothetical protein